MLNRHRIISLGLGLLYVVVLQIFSTPQPVFRFLLPALLGLLTLTFFYNRRYLLSLNKYNFWVLLKPNLLQVSAFLLLFLLPGPFSRGVLFVTAALFIVVFEIMLADYSENALLNEILLIAFGFSFAFFGLSQYFPAPGYLYFFGIFSAMFLAGRCFYEFTPHELKIKWLNSLIIAFLSAQIFWALNFLPFHYSALAIVLLDFFYLISVLNYHYLFHTLSAKKVTFYLSLVAISLVLVFSATPWTIIK